MQTYHRHGMGDEIVLALSLFKNGQGLTGKSPVAAIRKKSTGEWLNDAKTAWQAGYNDIALAELDSTNLSGIYTLDITHIDETSEEYQVYFKYNDGTNDYVNFESHLFTGEVYVPASSSYATGTIRGLLDTMRNKDVNRTFDQATDSLESIRDNWTATAILNGINAITLQVYETDTTTPISDVAISIFNSDETLILGTYRTDVNGQLLANLDDGTYKLRLRKAGAIFTVPETIEITEPGTEPLYGDTQAIPEPEDPDACNLVCDLFDLGLNAKAGIVFKVALKNTPRAVNSAVLEAAASTGTTDAAGRVIFTLAQGFTYQVTSAALGDNVVTVVIDAETIIVLGDVI